METLVGLAVLVLLFGITWSAVQPSLIRCKVDKRLSNLKQLHLATQQMALDGISSGSKDLGWPGDTGGTFTNWVHRLVPDYLSTNDFAKAMSGPGLIQRLGEIPQQKNCAALVYAVREESPGETVFLTSANFTNTPTGGAPPQPATKPYGEKLFVVFRKAGDGAILQSKQVGQTNLIGSYVPLLR